MLYKIFFNFIFFCTFLIPKSFSTTPISTDTKLTIPQFIIQEFNEEKEKWGNILNYMSYYAKSAISSDDANKNTFYMPLIKSFDDNRPPVLIMVDVQKMKYVDGKTPYFIVVKDTLSLPVHWFKWNERYSMLLQPHFSNIKECEQKINCKQKTTSQLHNIREIINVNVRNVHQIYFSSMITNMCNTCQPANVKTFLEYLEKRAKKEKIPSSLLYGIMYQESSGKCNRQQLKGENSHGLFQLNKDSTTELKECPNNRSVPKINNNQMRIACMPDHYLNKNEGTDCNPNYKHNFDKNITCLNNPYCNLEEAIRVLNCRWVHINMTKCSLPSYKNKEVCKEKYKDGAPKMPEKKWKDMSSEERNLWRYTIGAYNVLIHLHKGQKDLLNLTKEELGKTMGMNIDTINHYDLLKAYVVSQLCIKGNNQHACNNIFYIDKIAGTESDDAGSLINDWLQYRKKNSEIGNCPNSTIRTATHIEKINFH